MQCDPDWLKAQVFFRWDFYTVDVISAALRTLFDLKVILVYRAGDDYFAEIRHWKRHQSVHKPQSSGIPAPMNNLRSLLRLSPRYPPALPRHHSPHPHILES
jgi:hypothetical protein